MSLVIVEKNKGFITLTPAVLLSVAFIVMVSISFESIFQGTQEYIYYQNKINSSNFLRSCLHIALAKYIQNNSYKGSEELKIEDYVCVVSTIKSVAGVIEIETFTKDNKNFGYLKFSLEDKKIIFEELF